MNKLTQNKIINKEREFIYDGDKNKPKAITFPALKFQNRRKIRGTKY